MSRIVSPAEFVTAFHSAVRRREPELASFWEPWNAKEFTRLFVGPTQGPTEAILREVAAELGLQFLSPYWTLDGVLYERLAVRDSPTSWGVAESVAVAVEHENDPRTSAYEASKLSSFNVPLKVLITYPSGTRQESALLSAYSRILEAADTFHDFASLRKQIVAFAYKDHTISWRYYVYTNEGFVPLGESVA